MHQTAPFLWTGAWAVYRRRRRNFKVQATVADIAEIMEMLAPAELAEPWDNVGLQAGRMDWPVSKIWVALDPAPEVAAAACRQRVDLLVTHHPLIFDPLKKLDFASPVGQTLYLAARNHLAIFAAHTNLDSAAGGVNDLLASALGLHGLQALSAAAGGSGDREEDGPLGLGRVGDLPSEITLDGLARHIKASFRLPSLRTVGRPDLCIRRVAVCGGSAGGMLSYFFSSGAQVLVGGDFRYHDARSVESMDRGLVDIGHFASEYPVVPNLAERLRGLVAERGLSVRVAACGLETDPFASVD